MNLNIQNKVDLITGGDSGIGIHTAILLTLSDEDWMQTIQTDLLGAVRIYRALYHNYSRRMGGG